MSGKHGKAAAAAQRYAEDSSMGGVRNAARPGVFLKVVWVVVIVVCAVITVFSLHRLYLHHSRSRHSMTSYTNDAVAQDFPSVTLCNVNPVVSPDRLSEGDPPAARRRRAEYGMLTLSQFLQDYKIRKTNSHSEEDNRHLRHEYQTLVDQLSDQEREDAGHDLELMLSHCQLGDVPCDYRNFTRFYHHTFGNCFTFVADPRHLRVTKAGPQHGLTVELDTQSQEYTTQDEPGFVIVAHGSRDTVFPAEEGVFVPEGNAAYIALTKVGSLNACFMAKREFQVDLYERAADVRTEQGEEGRSINLTLANRGREALKAVDLEQRVIATGIHVHGRMVHCKDGTAKPMPYGKPGQSIISLNRKRLNEEILSAAEEYSNVRTHFNHKLICCNLDKGEVTFLHEGRELKRRADVIIGNDGAYSAVRGMMMKHPDVNMDFQQEYIPHCYMQIDIPSNSHGEFAMAENYIHVWPRENLLLVALPNPDRSFTAALFMECQLFHTLRDKDAIVPFFANHLPDALALIGEDSLRRTFMNNVQSRLISIKCNPHHYSSKSVIMGDAAHAMTPFYGQGMNCGFEDCLVLSELLDEYHNDFDKALPAYTERRYKDTHAIVNLAMQNYDVLRSSVNSPVFRFHKKVDRVLHSWFPSAWTDLYIAVAFSRKRYQHCVEDCSLQDKIVTGACILLLFCIVICALFPVCAYCL